MRARVCLSCGRQDEDEEGDEDDEDDDDDSTMRELRAMAAAKKVKLPVYVHLLCLALPVAGAARQGAAKCGVLTPVGGLPRLRVWCGGCTPSPCSYVVDVWDPKNPSRLRHVRRVALTMKQSQAAESGKEAKSPVMSTTAFKDVRARWCDLHTRQHRTS